MIWLSDSVMLTRAVLLSEMLSAMKRPIAARPFHCFCSVSRCFARIDAAIMMHKLISKDTTLLDCLSLAQYAAKSYDERDDFRRGREHQNSVVRLKTWSKSEKSTYQECVYPRPRLLIVLAPMYRSLNTSA